MSHVGLDSEATASTKAQMKIFLESSDATGRVVEDLVAATSSASFSASVGAGLSIIDVPHVVFGDFTVTSLGHVTEVLSPAFDAGTLFYEVNVTSLTYTLDASASNDAATNMGTRHLHCALDSSRVPGKERVLVSARDATTTTNVVHTFFQPVLCDCYAGTCNAFNGSCVFVKRSSTFQLQCPLS